MMALVECMKKIIKANLKFQGYSQVYNGHKRGKKK